MRTIFTESVRTTLREAANLGWKRQKINLTLRVMDWHKPGATKVKSIAAHVKGVWAIHRSEETDKGEGWSITHLPSGKHLVGSIRTLKQAKGGVDRLIAAVPSALNASEAELLKRRAEIEPWLKKIRG